VTLSAAIIVKDDADRLDACLTSLRGLVDEMIVVDTGSTEDAAAIAEQHGAVVAYEPWRGDFAAARNRGLELATGDWLLSVDADEQVHGDFEDARAYLDRAAACVGLRVRCALRRGWTPSRECRLWRNRTDIRFVGHIHETVVRSVRAAADAYALQIEPFDRITIRRSGDDVGRPDQRARDEPLLIAELARHPDRPVVYDHLARVYEAAGDGERAVATWKQGITRVRARVRRLSEDRLLYVDLINHLLANAVVDDELEALVHEARNQFVRTPTFELAAARLAFATGRPRDALEPLDWLIGLDDDSIIATGASYDERVFGEWAWALLGLCHFALGDDADAADAFGRAEQLAPGDASYAVRRRLADARAATPVSEPWVSPR
jgi:glycosyltransferase involved in cell wall biosynthesis